jgi:hypothetical protein
VQFASDTLGFRALGPAAGSRHRKRNKSSLHSYRGRRSPAFDRSLPPATNDEEGCEESQAPKEYVSPDERVVANAELMTRVSDGPASDILWLCYGSYCSARVYFCFLWLSMKKMKILNRLLAKSRHGKHNDAAETRRFVSEHCGHVYGS